MKNKATENTEGTERRLKRLAKFTASPRDRKIAETAGEAQGIEITCWLAGEGAVGDFRFLI
jgi:hypothetical protein